MPRAEKVGEAVLARNNQGVTFTSDGKYILVQNSSEKELLVFRITKSRLEDTKVHIKLPVIRHPFASSQDSPGESAAIPAPRHAVDRRGRKAAAPDDAY